MSILILGGTAEARELGSALGQRATLSLAGVTKKPLEPNQRRGGFGRINGLVRYLQENSTQAIIDATHPFASKISCNASIAAARLGIPLLRLTRAAWPIKPSWLEVATLHASAMALPSGARVFLSVGSRSIESFLPRGDIWFLCRSIETPANTPPHGEIILARPPFSFASELALLKAHNITHMVSKNAGGSTKRSKLKAAEKLGIKVIMVKRPQLPAAFEVETIADALKWVADLEDKT